MNDETFLVIWPERREVTAEKIASWYADAADNKEVDGLETNALAQAKALHDAGLITLGTRG